MKFTTEDITRFIRHSEFTAEGTEFATYNITFSLKPKDFLAFAESDLQSGLPHKFVNALSNAKRALDCQVICLLDIFGMLKLSSKKNWGFPTKIESLKKAGILAPGILKKINRTRNFLEHEFLNPNEEEVTDFIDVVALFIESTKKYLDHYLYFIESNWIEDTMLIFKVADEKITVEFLYVENESDKDLLSQTIEVEPTDSQFYDILATYHKQIDSVYY